MKLNEAIINIRVELQNKKIKMTGKNSHAGFNYFELSDFLPTLNELMKQFGVNDCLTIEKESAKLTLKKDDESQSYEIPFVMFEVPVTKSGGQMMQPIQYLGALVTYYKRYLYMNAFGITDGEVIDALSQDQMKNTPQQKQETKPKEEPKPQPKEVVKISQEQVKELESLFTSDEHKASFLAKGKISKLEDMPLSWFEKAKESLK